MSQHNLQLTEEMLGESGEVVTSAGNVLTKGLEQFYTPEAFTKFLSVVLCSDREPFSIIDLTAGNGALLAPLQAAGKWTFGIEIDKSNADKSLGICRANLLTSLPFILDLDLQFHKAALNPPFGLSWEFEGRTWNSAELTLKLASDLLLPQGEGVCIMHASNWRSLQDKIGREEFASVKPWAVLHVSNLFLPESECECVVLFFFKGNVNGSPIVREGLDFLRFGEWNLDLVEELLEFRRRFWRNCYPRLAHAEMMKRLEAACSAARDLAKSKVQRFNLELNGKQLRVHLSDFDTIRLVKKRGEEFVGRVRSWSGLSVRYFSMNTHEARLIRECIEKKLITAQPGLADAIMEAEARSAEHVAPFYALKATQRLGYLKELDKIECIKDDGGLGFIAGETYTIHCEVIPWSGKDWRTKQRRNGETYTEETIELTTEGKALRVTINGVHFTESPESIGYIVEHFEIPDPGDITSHKRSQYFSYLGGGPNCENPRATGLTALESPRFKFKSFQKDDLARLCCRRGGVLAWEQGLGKMIGGIGWALVKGFKRVLIVAPSDLIPQWQAEAREKFGVELHRITSPNQARSLAKRFQHEGKKYDFKLKREKGTGKRTKTLNRGNKAPEFFIIHYEALSRVGRVETEAEAVRWPVGVRPLRGESGEIIRQVQYASSEKICPKCRKSFAFDGRLCNPRIERKVAGEKVRGCGYLHVSRRVHECAHHLKNAFSAVIVDEGTKMKGDSSLMGLAVRSLNPIGRLVLTGTPIKNFLPDAYWLLFWATGASPSESFPYGYEDKMKFLTDYCVIEYETPCKRNQMRKGDKKVRPEISNLNMLWRVLNCNILRRRKVETGEDLKRKKLLPVRTPFSREQLQVYSWWLFNFGEWYSERPDTSINDPRVATALAGRLGQLWKLRQSASVPGLAGLEDFSGSRASSNITPKLLTTLKLIREGLEAREAVVVFSTILEVNRLLKSHLDLAGIKSRIVDGEVKPAERAEIVGQFKAGKFQVLLCGLEAMNLGHNIETARRAIVTSLPFDLASFDQAVNRIHRLTSLKDVMIHVLLTEKSIDERMWELIERKGQSAGLALDGALGFEEVEEVNWIKFAQELRESWSASSMDEPLTEAEIEREIERVFHGLHLVQDDKGRQLGAAAGLLDSVHLEL